MAHKPTYEQLEQRIEELERESFERKQEEAMLEASRRRYRALVENSPDMIYILDAEGRFRFLGGAFESLLGFTTGELTGKHFTSISWPEDIEKAKRHFGERRTGERSTKGFEVRLITSDGKKIDADIKYLSVELYAFGVYDKPVSAKDKKFLGTYGVARDITDRKRAEEALQTSARQWRTTFDAVNDPVSLLDMKGKFLRCNKAMTNFLGKSFEQIIGSNCWELLHHTSKPIEGCPMVAMGKTRCRETLVLETDDHQYLKITADPLVDEYGNLIGGVHIITDITERKKAEQTLRVSEEKFRSLNNKMDLGLSEVFEALDKISSGNPDVRIPETSEIKLIAELKRTVNLTAKNLKEIVDLSHEFAIGLAEHFDVLHRVSGGDLSARVSGTSQIELLEALRKVTNHMIESVFKEMTERKRAQKALKKYSNRLQDMVEERTTKLREAQEQLVRREKLAVMGQLAGGLGHELRNPLGAIKNSVYLLNMVLEDPEPEVKQSLEIIEKEVGISERVITSLLDFARPKPPTQREVDINDVVQAALSRVPVPENVEVVRQFSETLPTISADPDQLVQVFGNLALNAIQAMPEGGQLVVKSHVTGPDQVAITFADTGVGIPKEKMEKIFEPLFTTKAKGIGLGLALTKLLIERNGGTIDVKSEVEKGTTFTVSLPISREEQE